MRYVTYVLILIALILVGGLGVGFYLSPQGDLQISDAIVIVSGGETSSRVEEGVKLYHDGWAPLIIMSGAARDEGVSNATAMKGIAIDLGVPEVDILVEEKAQDTVGNAKYVNEFLEDLSIQSIILVTSPYHQRRAYLNFRHFLEDTIQIINHSATDSAWRKNGWWQDAWARHLTFSELQKIIYLPILLNVIK